MWTCLQIRGRQIQVHAGKCPKHRCRCVQDTTRGHTSATSAARGGAEGTGGSCLRLCQLNVMVEGLAAAAVGGSGGGTEGLVKLLNCDL